MKPASLVPELKAGGGGGIGEEDDSVRLPSGSPEGTELRLPALVQPEVLFDCGLSLGEIPDAATKWFLY